MKKDLKLIEPPNKAIQPDRPPVTKKSHINYHGGDCSEESIEP